MPAQSDRRGSCPSFSTQVPDSRLSLITQATLNAPLCGFILLQFLSLLRLVGRGRSRTASYSTRTAPLLLYLMPPKKKRQPLQEAPSKPTRNAISGTSGSHQDSSASNQSTADATHSCTICLDAIIDATADRDGHDAVFCDGVCNSWIHRRCAGLSSSAFKAISSPLNSKQPFHCPTCRLNMHSKEINTLKATVQHLSHSVALLQKNASNQLPLASPPAPTCLISQDSSKAIATKPFSLLPNPKPHYSGDRKYNLVMYGITEHSKGSPRLIRFARDFDSVISILSSLHPSIRQHSVRDCTRLGRFSDSRCRPILCTMCSSFDVSTVLAKRYLLSQKHPNIFIKPYLTPEALKIESALLKQRRDLITSGTLFKNIKIRDNSLYNSLYINGTKHGSVINSTYQTCPLVSTTPFRTSVPASTSAGLAASSTVLPATATCFPQPINTPLTSSLDSCHTSIPHPISTSPTSHSDTCQLPNTPIPYLINTSTSKTPILHHNPSPTSNSADLSNK